MHSTLSNPENCGKKNINPGVVRRLDLEKLVEEDTIRVFLRVKPISTDNINDDINSKHYELRGNSLIFKVPSARAQVFNEYFFTGILTPTASQTEVFDLIVRPRLEEVLLGSDTLLFSYGTSGSGKSYTIQGKGTEPGIIPRTLYAIFSSIENKLDTTDKFYPENSDGVILLENSSVRKLCRDKNNILELSEDMLNRLARKATVSSNDTIRATPCEVMEEELENMEQLEVPDDDCLYSVWLSFIEIYNENIYDLLVLPEFKVPLKLIMNRENNSFVKDIKYISAKNWEEAYRLYVFGKNNLHVSATSQNEKSSRSHSILTIKIIKRSKTDENTVYSSSFVICDLAGTERQKKTQNIGARLRESQNINTSTLVLNRCVAAIRANQSKKDQDYDIIPFRESKLTSLFKHALLGNSVITMIANMSQSGELTKETEQVLHATANTIKIKAKTFNPVIIKKKSFFADYCSTRLNAHPEFTSNETDEGVGGSLSCTSCLEYQKKIDLLQQTIEMKDIFINEEKKKKVEREQELRTELVKNFSKILDDTEEKHKERLERLEQVRRDKVEETRRICEAYCENKEKEISCLRRDMKVLQNKVFHVGKEFSIDLTLQENSNEEFYILDKVIETKNQNQLKILELEDTLSKAVVDFSELSNNSQKLATQNNQLLEEIAIKDQKIEEMAREIRNLSQILDSMNKKDTLENIREVVDNLGKLNLEDYELKDGQTPKGSNIQGRRAKGVNLEMDSESDDPTFFLPVQAATTGKKKKKPTSRKVNYDIPSCSFSEQITADETLPGTRSKRKLFRKDSDPIEGDLPLEIKVEVPQQSPGSYMRKLRNRRHE